MDQNLVYVKTAAGEEAVRQSTRVVQRNLRMVLVLVDGKTTVAELAAKVGNSKLVEDALRELEEGGFIATDLDTATVWGRGRKVAQGAAPDSLAPLSGFGGQSRPLPTQFSGFGGPSRPAASQFSTFGPRTVRPGEVRTPAGGNSGFSTFGKPILPTVDQPTRSGRSEAAAHGREPRGAEAAGSGRSVRRRQSRIAMVLGLAVLLLLGLGVLFYPYDRFRPRMEAELAQSLHLPVRIGNVSLALLPRPALRARDLVIGEQGEARIEEIRVHSPWALIGSGMRTVSGVEISGLDLPIDALGILARFGQVPARQGSGVVVEHAALKRLNLRIGDIALRSLEGELRFRAGALDKAFLQMEDRSLRIEATPTPQGAALSFEGFAWRPVEGSPYVFESLQAKGLLQPGKLILNNVDTTVLGGVLKGNWLLDWSNGMAMAGEAGLARLNARRVAEIWAGGLNIEGELSGNLRLRGSGGDWAKMWAGIEATLDVDIARGQLNGIDLGQAVRRGGGEISRGGATKFDHLRGIVRVEPQQVIGSNIHMDAGLFAADGQFVARGRQVDGLFDLSLRSSVAALRMPLRLSGYLPDLTAAAGR